MYANHWIATQFGMCDLHSDWVQCYGFTRSNSTFKIQKNFEKKKKVRELKKQKQNKLDIKN